MHVGDQILNELQLLSYLQILMFDEIISQDTFDLLFQTLLFIIQRVNSISFYRVNHVVSNSGTGPIQAVEFLKTWTLY